MPLSSPTDRRSGFSLVTILAAIALFAVLVGVVALNTGGAPERSKAGKVVDLVASLRSACASYHVDTGSYPYEYAGYAAAYRKLSGRQEDAAWRGPYIDAPLGAIQNPFGGSIHLYNTVTANGWISGFDCNGDGETEVRNSAAMLWLSGVPSSAAESIDHAIDAGIPGTWSDTGRVRYTPGNSQLYVLVYR
ncbi:MAG: hypothetical protein FJ299_05760 [Planctomycetes bacterium]|nr:hypothetical protein [Planctomycetota bacterium]